MNRLRVINMAAGRNKEQINCSAKEPEVYSTLDICDPKRFAALSSIVLSFTKKCSLSSPTKPSLPTARGYSNMGSIRLKKQRKKRRKTWHISTKKKMAVYRPRTTFHHISGGKRFSSDFYAESTLYTIPEHGAGLCHMRYVTKRVLGGKTVWSIYESNYRPHHRRADVVLSGFEPTDRSSLRRGSATLEY